MIDYIPIPETLLAEAGRLLAPPNPTPDDTDVPRALLEALVGYYSVDLGCDHSVGICMCELVDLVGDLKLALDGRRRCPECAGDGAVYSDEAYESAAVQYAAHYETTPEDAKRYMCDLDGMIKCPTCGSNGSVPTSKLEASNG